MPKLSIKTNNEQKLTKSASVLLLKIKPQKNKEKIRATKGKNPMSFALNKINKEHKQLRKEREEQQNK